MNHPHQMRRNIPMNQGDFKKNIVKLIKSYKAYYFQTIISFICVTISVVLAIIAPQYLSDLADTITAGAATGSIVMSEITRIAIILIVFYASNALLHFISGFIMNTITQKYSRDLREQISKKINRMKLKYFDSHPYGDTLSIVTNDIDQLGQSLQQSISMVVQSIFQIVGVLIAMFITNWIMALVVLASIPLVMIMTAIVLKIAMPLFVKRQRQLGVVNGIVEENYTGSLVITAFNAEKTKGIEFTKANNTLKSIMYRAQFFGGLMQPMTTFISYFAYSAVCLVGGLLLANGNQITFGTITAFLVYINLFQSPLSQVAQSMNTLQMASAAAGRVFEFLEEEELLDESQISRKIDTDEIKGSVEFKNVQFGYNEDRIIIPNFSAIIKPGMKVAIVGPTGAGKTTIVNLLMKFYEVNSGDILIDGVSSKEICRSDIRKIFGMVLQDTWIFDGTLKDNIIFSTPNVSDERLNEVIKEANLKHYVDTLPHGLDTIINDDSSLSGGQKQLITIARAMCENSPLLILDEATSNVDTRTEILIQNAMDKLTKGRTSFVIAHRLSTIKNADLILVMKDGNIIEQGTHEELLSQKGFYESLYNSQFNLEA